MDIVRGRVETSGGKRIEGRGRVKWTGEGRSVWRLGAFGPSLSQVKKVAGALEDQDGGQA